MKGSEVDAELRLSESVGTFGVGAIVDVRGESFVAPEAGWWREYDVVECGRLIDRIGPGELRAPRPISQESARYSAASMTLLRFPSWRFCEVCGHMSRFGKKQYGPGRNKCGDCGKGLVPMRFVAACEQGSHMQEVPWKRWVHGGGKVACDDGRRLYFERLRDKGEGLRSLRVVCRACEVARTLDELVGSHALATVGERCRGRQPWEHRSMQCDSPVAAVLRGATSLFRAEFVSALDIPAPAGADPVLSASNDVGNVAQHALFEQARQYVGTELATFMARQIAEEEDVDVEEVLALLEDEDTDDEVEPGRALKLEEWAAFREKISLGRDTGEGDFVVDGAKFDTVDGHVLSPASLELFSGIGKVRRLREVKAQTGFSRRNPGAKFVQASAAFGPERVFPTAELYGEGIFVTFSEERLAEWERQERPRYRSELLDERAARLEWAARFGAPTPRLLMLHTFSHVLLRRLSFESGYSTAALRERLYSSEVGQGGMCGLLIYTAATDEQGTLGGLVRLADPVRLESLIANALEDAEVCSNDPICVESDTARTSSLNLAACHGCCMVSETSCEFGNRFLDRQTLFGSPAEPRGGYFGIDYLNLA